MITFGPVLSFRGSRPAGWDIGVLVRDDSQPGTLEYRVSGGAWVAVQATQIGDGWLPDAYRYDLTLPLRAAAQSVEYRFPSAAALGPWAFTLPSRAQAPRLAYASCNGFGSPDEEQKVRVKNDRWIHLRETHDKDPYHILMMGGDQVYADEMFKRVRLLEEWNALDWKSANSRKFTAPMQVATRGFYQSLYPRRWGQEEVARVMASIPTLMMWDDHDIFDGWGSYPDERRTCDVHKGLFGEAREAFRIYQRQLSVAEQKGGSSGGIATGYGYSFAHVVGGPGQQIGILGIDMRTERTEKQVLSRDHWDALYAWLGAQSKLQHLLVLASIPVVYPSIKTIERIIGALPGRKEIEDDLRDQWSSRAHEEERVRLVHRLLDFARNTSTRVTIVSGDVHVAALGVLTSTREQPATSASVINQLTSSAIVHPAPAGMVLFGMESLMGNKFDIDRGISAELVALPGTERRYIGARNWLAIEPDPPGANPPRLWAKWHVEGEKDHPYTKVIHPV